MFCCLSGSSKPDPSERKELAVNLKNKRPEDFMKDPIPLSLSDRIGFQLGRDRKWTAEVSKTDRVNKKDDS